MVKRITGHIFLAFCLLLGAFQAAYAMTDAEAREEGTKLFQQIESFKDSPAFKKHGFNEAKGNPGPELLLKVQKLKSETADVEMGLGFAIMFLEDLGKAYASGNIQEIKTYRRSIESELGGGTSQEAKVENPIGHPLAINVLAYKEDERNGRNRLNITIIPAEDQSKATQADLAATAVAVATQAQKESKAHIVTVTMNCQKAANSFGELQLARVVYIPDGLGMNGKTEGKIWESIDAAPRGFTKQELNYLQLWAEMRDQFKSKNGEVDEKKLKAAVAKKMNIKPDSLTPHMNMREPVKGELNIEGELKIIKNN